MGSGTSVNPYKVREVEIRELEVVEEVPIPIPPPAGCHCW